MKILDARDGFVKFEADNESCLYSFVRIDDSTKSYTAQIVRVKSFKERIMAFAKILYGEGQEYDEELPSIGAEIRRLPADFLKNQVEIPLIAGKTSGGENIVINSSVFCGKTLMCIERDETVNILTGNFAKQLNNQGRKAVIIDTCGIINSKKYKAGTDFKLPLDRQSLEFIYNDCLNEATADSRPMIAEIFRDLAEYADTVPFVPFNALKMIVDDMVARSYVFKLLVLKKKLAEFDKAGYFANNAQETEVLRKITDSECVIFDLSKLAPVFMNRYFNFVYQFFNDNTNVQIFSVISSAVSRQNIKKILLDAKTDVSFIVRPNFKYLNDIKGHFDNFIITPSLSGNPIFRDFSGILNIIPKKSFLIAGKSCTPLVSGISIIDETLSPMMQDNCEEETCAIPDKEFAENEQQLGECEIITPENTEADEDYILNELKEAGAGGIFTEEDENTSESPAQLEENASNVSETDFSKDIEEMGYETDGKENFSTEVHSSDEMTESIIESILPYESLAQFQNETNAEVMLSDTAPESTEDETEASEIEVAQEEIPDSMNDIMPESDGLADVQAEIFGEQISEVVQEEIPDSINDIMPEPVELDTEDTDIKTTEEVITLDSDFDLLETEEDAEKAADEVPSESVEISEELSLSLEREINIIPLPGDSFEFDEITELNSAEANENDIIIDIDEDSETELNKEIIRDVDKVYTTRKEDDISDADLDLIDELNNGGLSDEAGGIEILEETENELMSEEPAAELEESIPLGESSEILETKISSIPIVPVYDAEIPQEDMVTSDPIQQGDSVYHAKYGSGIVEKMIKYGNKTLYSINFDNVGRRLLDPAIAQIKKI